MTNGNTQLPELTPQDRLFAYNSLIQGCTHLYSKGALQMDKFLNVIPTLISLAKHDPEFLAKLAVWGSKQPSKDLFVLTTYANFLNDADGKPFFQGATRNKPNYRQVSAALLQDMPPNLALRILELGKIKYSVKDLLANGTHFPRIAQKAFMWYLVFRENNLNIVKGIVKAGLRKKLILLYRLNHMAPSKEVAGLLKWKQKGRDIIKSDILSFEGLSTEAIVEKIINEKLSPIVALPKLADTQINASIAKALLQVSTGNQAIILQGLFRSRGFLEIPEINDLFLEKISTATTAIDRIDTLSKNATDEDKKKMAEIRANVRKAQIGNKFGKIFIHIDISGSMDHVVEYAKESGSILAECVDNPQENFRWGVFNSSGRILPNPTSFTKEDFYASLYGVRAGGGTDVFALYKQAREFGADVDVYITDQNTINGSPSYVKNLIEKYGAPKAVLIIAYPGSNTVEEAFKANNIPVSVMKPEALKSSALVTTAIETAIKGQIVIIEEIMNTPLPSLPKWWGDKSLIESYKARI
jgi:hypothetical protein